MKGLRVIQPGIQSLIQDRGRYGFHNIGLTTGGPLDRNSFRWANRLCGNDEAMAGIEIMVGGLVLEAQISTQIAVTGAHIPLKINQQAVECWRSHAVRPGDRIELGYATAGCRAYLAVSRGIQVKAIFNSVSTVVREGLGGLEQEGGALKSGDILPCESTDNQPCFSLPAAHRPVVETERITLRVVLGYQEATFKHKQRFFSADYRVSENSDRMGYRLSGPAIKSSITGMLSEGICLGAIQFPADGQPIILLSDRQTIGGYPKIGSVLSIDIDKVAQLMPGKKLRFEAIGIEQAHNLIHLHEQRFATTSVDKISANISHQ
jgi:biotin-dependent carboxylase-like uncharacterized protein